jgi:hypothetical protein
MMAISRTSAERLCSGPELELVEASYPASVKQLTPGRLRQKVQRARRLRDKYRDLSRRQRLETRGKRDARASRPSQGHANTDRKAELFQEVLDRFETQLGRAEPGAAAGRPAADAAGKKTGAKKAGAGKAGGKKAGGKKAGGKKTGAKKAGAEKAGTEKAGAEKAGGKKAGAKKAGTGKAGANKAGAKQAGGGTTVGRSPAEGRAQPAPPGRPGAAAMKGARQRLDASQQAQGKVARAHTRASNRRSQTQRDTRR